MQEKRAALRKFAVFASENYNSFVCGNSQDGNTSSCAPAEGSIDEAMHGVADDDDSIRGHANAATDSDEDGEADDDHDGLPRDSGGERVLVGTKSCAASVAVPQLVWLTACLVLEDRVAARRYCDGLGWAALCPDGFDVILSAGCIPSIIDCLRRWSADQKLVYLACEVLHFLARDGSTLARIAINSVPGIVDLLQAADASGFADNYAADILKNLQESDDDDQGETSTSSDAGSVEDGEYVE